MRFARFELSLKKTRKNQEKKKQIKIEMMFGFFMFPLKKRRDTNQATKIKKNQTRFEIFFENSLEIYKKKNETRFFVLPVVWAIAIDFTDQCLSTIG